MIPDPNYDPSHPSEKKWLPISKKEMDRRGWEEVDVVLFSGDAYVDHPAFGAAVIGRVLENLGLKVAIVPQPNWKDDLRDFKKMGKPRLFFGITAGNMDSMVNHYTANKRIRSNDPYTPGDKAGFRPDRALSVYASIVRELFPDSLIIAGGIEASLRRLSHYDYWADKLHPSVLADKNIDYLVYGNGEQCITEIALNLLEGKDSNSLREIPQLAYLNKKDEDIPDFIKVDTVSLKSHDECLNSKRSFAQNFRIIEETSNIMSPPRLIQEVGSGTVVVNPSYPTPTTEDLDSIHKLPFTRLPHPRYWKKPLIPAFEMIRFSINIHRGCFGGCAFCTISAHQGKFIQSRSEDSVVKEAQDVSHMPGFKGYISDLGGPSANMYQMAGVRLGPCMKCKRPSCIDPDICPNLNTDHTPLINLYNRVRKLPGIKKAFIGSGIRYDLIVSENQKKHPSHEKYAEQLIRHHVSGRLKVAPEHTHSKVLSIMRKPSFSHFLKFRKIFDRINERHNLKQQLIPYFISAHPGCKKTDMAELAVKTKDLNFKLEQVQDFTPTPMTVATVMFYTGLDPYTLRPVFTDTKTPDKKAQRRFFFWYKREEQEEIRKELSKLNRPDLIQLLLGRPPLKKVKRKR